MCLKKKNWWWQKNYLHDSLFESKRYIKYNILVLITPGFFSKYLKLQVFKVFGNPVYYIFLLTYKNLLLTSVKPKYKKKNNER